MTRIILKLKWILGEWRRISGLNLPAAVKARIRKTWLRVIVFRRYDSVRRTAEIAGFKIRYCSPDSMEYLFRELFINQEYLFVAESGNPFIVDCGSNIGMSVLYFKTVYPDCAILAFEPDEDAFACLEENVKVNGLKSVDINKRAVSKSDGRIDFWYAGNNPGALGNTIRGTTPRQTRSAEAVRLSNYIDREVDFLKLDVEGAELEVIGEMNEAGKLRRVKQMIIEYHIHMAEEEDDFSKILRLLEDAGFGYQIGAFLERPFKGRQFQPIHIYAYRKESAA